MKCSRFERWLDEGMPEPDAAPARDHAARCGPCGIRLAAAVELDALFDEGVTAAPATFTDRLMARIEQAPPPERAALPLFLPDPLPWWVRAAGDPATALSFILAGLVVWRLPVLVEIGTRLVNRLADLAQPAWTTPPAGNGSTDAAITLALTVGFAPLLAWASFLLYRASRNLAERTARPS